MKYNNNMHEKKAQRKSMKKCCNACASLEFINASMHNSYRYIKNLSINIVQIRWLFWYYCAFTLNIKSIFALHLFHSKKNEQKLKWNSNYPSKLLVSFIPSLTSMSIRSHKWKKIENSCVRACTYYLIN